MVTTTVEHVPVPTPRAGRAVDVAGRVLWPTQVANDQQAIAELIGRIGAHDEAVWGSTYRLPDSPAGGDVGSDRAAGGVYPRPDGQDDVG
ncbi:hypothetical protein [Micromonospora chersina]|uniref:hypothetical protein n=1 Tax=Micromonospora chersina TaxID=47854 RepID=UPI0033CB8FC5